MWSSRDRESLHDPDYGTDLKIAGQYTGKLSPGEQIRLEDAVGRTIHER